MKCSESDRKSRNRKDSATKTFKNRVSVSGKTNLTARCYRTKCSVDATARSSSVAQTSVCDPVPGIQSQTEVCATKAKHPASGPGASELSNSLLTTCYFLRA